MLILTRAHRPTTYTIGNNGVLPIIRKRKIPDREELITSSRSEVSEHDILDNFMVYNGVLESKGGFVRAREVSRLDSRPEIPTNSD